MIHHPLFWFEEQADIIQLPECTFRPQIRAVTKPSMAGFISQNFVSGSIIRWMYATMPYRYYVRPEVLDIYFQDKGDCVLFLLTFSEELANIASLINKARAI